MVKVMPTYATRKALIERRIQALRNDKARYERHGWLDIAKETQQQINEAHLELKALARS